MKPMTAALMPYVIANVLLLAGAWLVGIQIGDWRIGGVAWAWGEALGWIFIISAAILMWVPIIRAQREKRRE